MKRFISPFKTIDCITILVGTSLIQWQLDNNDEERHEERHKQTYLEYVQERLEVERLMR